LVLLGCLLICPSLARAASGEKDTSIVVSEQAARPYRVAAWSGVGITLALLVSGTVLGVLAQNRSDELSRRTGQGSSGPPPLFDAAERDAYTSLQSDGLLWNRAAIACLLVAGVTALGSGLFFWDAARRTPKEQKLSLRPGFAEKGAHLFVALRF
jgi:hypothetical protein